MRKLVSQIITRAPTWEYYLPWESLNSARSKLASPHGQGVVHIKVVLTFKSPFSACFHQGCLVIAFSGKPRSNPRGPPTHNKEENSE